MIDLPPPPRIWLPPKPAIIQSAEPWTRRLESALRWRGLSEKDGAKVVAEVKRLEGVRAKLFKPGILGLEKDFGLPLFAWLPGMVPAINSGSVLGPAPILTYINSAATGTGGTSYAAGNFTAASAGLMIVGVSGSLGNAPTVTIATVSAINCVTGVAAGNNGDGGFWILSVTSGSKAVAVQSTSTSDNFGVSVWLLTAGNSWTPTYAITTFDATNNTNQVIDANMLDSAVAVYRGMVYSQDSTLSWTGATERQDVEPGSDGQRVGGADYTASAGDETPHNCTLTWTGNSASQMAVAVFR